MTLAPDFLDLLRSVDTPTVCNAIEVAQGKRGFDAFTRGAPLISEPAGRVVGFARTAQIAAMEPPTEAPEVIKARRMDYYRYMAEAPAPAVTVIEDLDPPEKRIGAYWGEINTAVHKAFGIAGVLTNGVMRDLGDLPEGFPVIAGSVGPSHGFVHVRSIDKPVTVFGLTVAPGDLIHADRHGAVVIPPDLIEVMADAIGKLLSTEALVLGPARERGFGFAEFEAAWAAFEAART